MLSSERFKKNVDKWAAVNHSTPSVILNADCRHLNFCVTGSDEQNLKIEKDGHTVYYHSPDGAQQEAEQWMKELDLADDKILYVYGIGLGYYYDAAKEWLNSNLEHLLIFLEKDPAVFHRLFETEKGEEILNSNQVLVYWYDTAGGNAQRLLEKLGSMYVFSDFQISALKYYLDTDSQQLAVIEKTISYFRNLHSGSAIESMSFGKGFFTNFYSNILYLSESYLGNALKDKFKGVPAIVCGAGPSLGKNLDLLGTLKDRALIFAGGTAMNALNTGGVLPHFGVGIDPNWHHYLRLITNIAYEVPFFYRTRMFHHAFRAIHGDKLYVCGSIPYGISKTFEEKFGIKEEAITEGFNVINFSVEIAKLLGCSPIITVGVDLAYTNDKSYASGIVTHPLHDSKRNIKTKEASDELVVRPDVNGKPVNTLWKWVNESLWYTNFVQTNPGVAVINSTEGGLGFPGVLNIPLAYVAEHILKKQYDIETRIHTEMQNSRMPPEVTFEKVKENILETRASMITCLQLCYALKEEYGAILNDLTQGKDGPPNLVTDSILDHISALDGELAYSTLIIYFDEKYLHCYGQYLRRLENEEDHSKAHEIAKQKVTLNVQRFAFLVNNIADHVGLIDSILMTQSAEAEKTEQFLLHPSECFEVPKENEEDPEIEGRGEDQYLLHYPDGKVKFESFYRDGLLHGPTTSYGTDGKVLGKKWFINGKAEGKAKYYYASGALKSIQRFRNGQWDGKQEFFYQNGQVKSILSYKNGALDGEVRLFFPDGKPEKELQFLNGKRHGHEKNWDTAGQLVLDVEWAMDKPAGVARSWYQDGKKAKEVTFNSNHQVEKVEQWDMKGTPWSDSQYEQGADYLEVVTKQTNLLANSFDHLIEQVKQLLPLVHLKGGDETKKSFQGEINHLVEKLTHLHEINTKLIEASGANDENQIETLWKSPSHRKVIQRQIEEVSEKLSTEINQMRHALGDAVQKLYEKSAQIPPPPPPPSKS